MNKWLWLAVISLSISGLFIAFLASAMIAKGGSHVVYCPNLPAGHFLPCMPSPAGIGMALLMTMVYAVPVFAVGSSFVLFSGKRRGH